MMKDKETILLDAELDDVIEDTVFRARLENGHRIVAFAARKNEKMARLLRPGEKVMVSMSPYDMSKGRIECPEVDC